MTNSKASENEDITNSSMPVVTSNESGNDKDVTNSSMQVLSSNETAILNKPNKENRINMIETAVTFLQNPSVSERPRQEKINFLTKKGLTPQEISTAFMKVENSLAVRNNEPGMTMSYNGLPPLIPERSTTSVWSTVKSTANVLILLSGAAYGCHFLYQWIQKTYFKGNKLEDQQRELIEYQKIMQKTMERIQISLDQMHAESTSQNKMIGEFLKSCNKSVNGEKDELISELECIKSLLLNKRAFPAAPATGLALPEWQKIKTKTEIKSVSDINEPALNGVNNHFDNDNDLPFEKLNGNGSDQINGSEVSVGQKEQYLSKQKADNETTSKIENESNC